MLRILRLSDEEFELVEASIESLRRQFVVKRASRSVARNVAGSLRVFHSLRDFTAIGVADPTCRQAPSCWRRIIEYGRMFRSAA